MAEKTTTRITIEWKPDEDIPKGIFMSGYQAIVDGEAGKPQIRIGDLYCNGPVVLESVADIRKMVTALQSACRWLQEREEFPL